MAVPTALKSASDAWSVDASERIGPMRLLVLSCPLMTGSQRRGAKLVAVRKPPIQSTPSHVPLLLCSNLGRKEAGKSERQSEILL